MVNRKELGQTSYKIVIILYRTITETQSNILYKLQPFKTKYQLLYIDLTNYLSTKYELCHIALVNAVTQLILFQNECSIFK